MKSRGRSPEHKLNMIYTGNEPIRQMVRVWVKRQRPKYESNRGSIDTVKWFIRMVGLMTVIKN